MQIYDELARAQGGRAIQNLARAANVAPEQMDAVIKAVIPHFSSAIERNTLSRGGLADFLEALGDGHHEYILDNPQSMADPRVREDGNEVLAHVLGSKDRSRAVAYQAAQASGLGEGLIKMLLPFIAQMLMGAIAKWAKGGLGDVISKLPGGMGGGDAEGGRGGGRLPFPMPGSGGEQDQGGWDGSSGDGGGRSGGRTRGGSRGGPFELPRAELPPGGYPMPPMPGSPQAGGPEETLPGGGGLDPGDDDAPVNRRQRQGRGAQAPDAGGSSPFPFPFPFPLPGQPDGDRPQGDQDGGFQIPWPRRQDRPMGGDGGSGPMSLPRSELPQGGYPMPPMPDAPGPSGGGSMGGGSAGGGLPLPMPGGGRDNPYGDLSDILRRGGAGADGSGGLGGTVRDAIGGLLGFGSRGIVGWIVRLLVVRFGWGLLKRLLGRLLTGR